MKLEELDGIALGELIGEKKISPVEVIDYFARRIEGRNESVNAFVYTKFDEARDEAKQLEKRIAAGEAVGLFAGVPTALKDFLPSKTGWENSHGGVPPLVTEDMADSEFYKAAHSLGAIAIGKTNAPAFGFSGACQNKMYSATANPFDLTRTSGGSSGGTAAAVADGLIPFGEGGDAGGSVRLPSGWCNLFGYKPSLGTVPSYCRPDAWTATHPYCFNSVLAKSVRDTAAILTEMASYNPRDPISLPLNANIDFKEAIKQPLDHPRIAVTMDFDLYSEVDSEIKDLMNATLKNLELAGADIEEVSFNFKHSIDEIMFCWSWAISVDTALDLAEWKQNGLDLIKDWKAYLPSEFIEFNQHAADIDIHDFRKFNEIRTDILDNFEDVFENYDFIASPTAVCKPMPLKDEGHCISVNGVALNPKTNFISFGETPLANFVGYPAASVPAGLTTDKLPIGMQIIGKQYDDVSVLQLSKLIESVQPWQQHYHIAYDRM